MAYGNYAPFYRGGYFNPMQTPTMPQMADNQNMQAYGQPYQQPIQQMQMQTPAPFSQTQPTNDMIWVLGQTEAESYPVALNNSVVLWDKSNPTIYIKSMNAQGMPSMRILDFTERNTEVQNNAQNAPKSHSCSCGGNFATKEQIDDLRGKIDDLTVKYEALSRPVAEKPKTTIKKFKESEE